MKGLNFIVFFVILSYNPSIQGQKPLIQSVDGLTSPDPAATWLSHEHILVDFIGADSIHSGRWDRKKVSNTILPYLLEAKNAGVDYFVDATPAFLGRDPLLLQELSRESGLKIITNTGYYGARNNKYVPTHAYELNAKELAKIWIEEFQYGINGSGVKPGFIKISVDATAPLDPMHQKLVRAAAITHLETGLTIASHTGEATGLWPQLAILEAFGVSPKAFIWVHAQQEEDPENYILAAQKGCWISLDGLGWDTKNHLEKILFARDRGILDHILISHDAGWYDPVKSQQEIRGYLNIFENLLPKLRESGFSQQEIDLLMSANPARALAIKIKNHE